MHCHYLEYQYWIHLNVLRIPSILAPWGYCNSRIFHLPKYFEITWIIQISWSDTSWPWNQHDPGANAYRASFWFQYASLFIMSLLSCVHSSASIAEPMFLPDVTVANSDRIGNPFEAQTEGTAKKCKIIYSSPPQIKHCSMLLLSDAYASCSHFMQKYTSS